MATVVSQLRRRPNPVRWVLSQRPGAPAADQIKRLCTELRLTEVAARILHQRGHGTVEAASAFLSRRMDLLHDPCGLQDMAKAVERIAEAVEKGQKILLFGDYDADGVTSTALLARFLRLLKAKTGSSFVFLAVVPERNEGYGLSAAAVRKIVAHRPDLLITLDNGISAHDPIEQIAAAGIDCIIVDHHHAGAELPRAVAVINPRRHDAANSYPFPDLCGAGVTFKLAWALAVRYSQHRKVSPEFKAFLLNGMALAAIGTIADVVPLVGENRVIAFHGLAALSRTSLPGLQALLETSGIKADPRGKLRPSDVAFRLGPRLNAAGRCGHAAEALEVLLTDDPVRAFALAQNLEAYNDQRQQLEAAMLDEAREHSQTALNAQPGRRALVLHSAEWHLGVIGIVASRIAEEFSRPVLLLSTHPENGMVQGSGRSLRGLHLYDALSACQQHLLAFGGHAAAAGLTLESSKVDAFSAAFEETVAALLSDDDLLPRLHVDEQIQLHQADAKLCAELEQFEPCGMGNPQPVLAVLGAAISSPPRLMGKDEQHVSFFVQQGKAARRVVGFRCAERFEALCDAHSSGSTDFAFRLQSNTFRGETSIELIMDAFRPGGES